MLVLLAVRSSGVPPDWFWYPVIGASAVIVAVFLLNRRYERRRSEALAAAALQHGLLFEPEGEPFREVETPALHLFTAGRSRRSRNIMRGSSSGLEVTIFDYQYVTGSGKNQSTHRQTVATFRIDGATLPGFQLRHETVFDKIASAFGYQDLDFPEHPEFSRRYVLRGKDEDAVRTLFSSALIDFFEQLAAGEKWWTVEGAGDLVVVYRADARVRPEELAQFLQDATTVASQFRQGNTAKFGH